LLPPHLWLDWWRPRLTARTALLLPASWLFAGLIGIRRYLFRRGVLRSFSLDVPVIIVGNITVGGSGKTPLAIALVHALRAAGYTPGVISRGYGGSSTSSDPIEVTGRTTPEECGDEPLLIRQRTGVPVFVCRNRVAAARALRQSHPGVNVLVSDDGLQHLALAGGIRLAVFDERGIGNGRLLPAGPLREPLSSVEGLTALVCHGSEALLARMAGSSGFAKVNPPPVYRMQFEPGLAYQLVQPDRRVPVASLAEKGPVAAVAGIGHPPRFFATLEHAGLAFSRHPFPDHHLFCEADLEAVEASVIIMTEKDAIKCKAFDDARIWVLPVDAALDPLLIARILETLRGPKAA
jgi:tetraacyldisaccharide 4'-kinase